MTTPKMQFIWCSHIGDVDGDGTVSHQDKTALVDAWLHSLPLPRPWILMAMVLQTC